MILDDLFAYSHHASDPAFSQALNAFDLVRLHKFGDLDDNFDPEKLKNKRPSVKAMEQFCREDERCRIRNIDERTSLSSSTLENKESPLSETNAVQESGTGTEFVQAEQKNDDEALDVAEDSDENASSAPHDKWKATLEVDKLSGITANHKNVELILENDEELKDRFGFDEFKQRVSIIGKVP